MPSWGNQQAMNNSFTRAVAACQEPISNRYYYEYGYVVRSAYRKLPVICQMRAPLESKTLSIIMTKSCSKNEITGCRSTGYCQVAQEGVRSSWRSGEC